MEGGEGLQHSWLGSVAPARASTHSLHPTARGPCLEDAIGLGGGTGRVLPRWPWTHLPSQAGRRPRSLSGRAPPRPSELRALPASHKRRLGITQLWPWCVVATSPRGAQPLAWLGMLERQSWSGMPLPPRSTSQPRLNPTLGLEPRSSSMLKNPLWPEVGKGRGGTSNYLAVLETVGDGFRGTGELSLLPYQHEPDPQPLGQDGSKQEAAGIQTWEKGGGDACIRPRTPREEKAVNLGLDCAALLRAAPPRAEATRSRRPICPPA